MSMEPEPGSPMSAMPVTQTWRGDFEDCHTDDDIYARIVRAASEAPATQGADELSATEMVSELVPDLVTREPTLVVRDYTPTQEVHSGRSTPQELERTTRMYQLQPVQPTPRRARTEAAMTEDDLMIMLAETQK